MGLPPDVPRSAEPLPGEHPFPPQVRARLQRARLRSRSSAVSAVRARSPSAHRPERGDADGLRVLRLRRLPARTQAHRLERGLDFRNRLRLRRIPRGAPARLPLCRVDAAAPGGDRSLRARPHSAAGPLARRHVLPQRTRRPLADPRRDSAFRLVSLPRGPAPAPRRPGSLDAQCRGDRDVRALSSPVSPPVPARRGALRLRSRPRRDGVALGARGPMAEREPDKQGLEPCSGAGCRGSDFQALPGCAPDPAASPALVLRLRRAPDDGPRARTPRRDSSDSSGPSPASSVRSMRFPSTGCSSTSCPSPRSARHRAGR